MKHLIIGQGETSSKTCLSCGGINKDLTLRSNMDMFGLWYNPR